MSALQRIPCLVPRDTRCDCILNLFLMNMGISRYWITSSSAENGAESAHIVKVEIEET